MPSSQIRCSVSPCHYDTRTHTSPPAPTRKELIDLSNAASLREIINNNRTEAAKAAREQFLEQIEDTLTRYPSDFGDMYLLSDIQSLRTQQQGVSE